MAEKASKGSTRSKGRVVSSHWLAEYTCKYCAGNAIVANGFVKILHGPKCKLRKTMNKRFPAFMDILRNQWWSENG